MTAIRPGASPESVAAVAGDLTSHTTAAADAHAIGAVTGLQAALDKTLRGTDGRKYRIVSGVIRRAAGVWSIIDDEIHRACGIASVTEDDKNDWVRIDFDQTFGKVVSFVACPDETYTINGYHFGASVAPNLALITASRVPRSCGGYLRWTASGWVVSGATGNLAVTGWADGILTLSHDAMDLYSGSVTSRDGTLIAQLGSLSTTTTQVVFRDFAGTLVTDGSTAMRIYVQRTRAGGKVTDMAELNQVGANIWVLGVFEEA